MSERPQRPRFKRVSIYNSPDKLLSFWYPPEWELVEKEIPHRSVTLYPSPADKATLVTIQVRDLKAPLQPEEHSVIMEGIKEGLQKLDDCVVEKFSELDDKSGSWGVEWICEFSYDGHRRRRRSRIFYSDHYQYSVMFQGSTLERFRYWQGMFEFVMLTVGSSGFSLVEWAATEYPKFAEEGGAIE